MKENNFFNNQEDLKIRNDQEIIKLRKASKINFQNMTYYEKMNKQQYHVSSDKVLPWILKNLFNYFFYYDPYY